MDPEPGRVLDPLCEKRFPNLAIYRRKEARSLLESVELDLDERGGPTILRVCGSDRGLGRGVLEVTTRMLVVVNGDGNPFRTSTWEQLCASANGVILRARKFPFVAGVSYPIRSFWNIGDNVGFVFEDEDYHVLSRALDELAPLLALRGASMRKGDRWHRVDLPQPPFEKG